MLVCQLVGGSGHTMPRDREARLAVVRDYQAMCTEVVQRFDGHLAQSQGERLLVYFGYPRAHEDDARRAVLTGLGMVEGMVALNRHRQHGNAMRLAVQVGIHTGVELMGAVGRSDQRASLVVGETPTIAAGLQHLAEPDTVVISPATWRLVEGYFVCEALGAHLLEDFSEPLTVYRVLQESTAHTRLEVAITRGLTPFVGREHEVGLLHECWAAGHRGAGASRRAARRGRHWQVALGAGVHRTADHSARPPANRLNVANERSSSSPSKPLPMKTIRER